MIGVIADYKTYSSFLRQWVEPSDHKKFKHIDRREAIMGIVLTDVIHLGDFRYLVKDYAELSLYAHTRVRNNGR